MGREIERTLPGRKTSNPRVVEKGPKSDDFREVTRVTVITEEGVYSGGGVVGGVLV